MNTLTTAFSEVFERDILKLKEEISLYKNESDLWIVKEGIGNSAGNLSLHLIGNLNHFIGAVLGKNGFERERDKEFSSKNVARAEMIDNIDKTLIVVKNVFQTLPDELLNGEFPIEMFGKKQTTHFMLVHLVGHLEYHLGQINYHRRLLAS